MTITQGISPKVYVPLLAGIFVGVLLLVLWLVAGQDDEILLTTALTTLAAALTFAGLGFAARPGATVEDVPSDELLGDPNPPLT